MGPAGRLRAAVWRSNLWRQIELSRLCPPGEGSAVIRVQRRVLEDSPIVVPDAVRAWLDYGEAYLAWDRGDIVTADTLAVRAARGLESSEQSYQTRSWLIELQLSIDMTAGRHDVGRSRAAAFLKLREESGDHLVLPYQYGTLNDLMAGELDAARSRLDSAPQMQGKDNYARTALVAERARLALLEGRVAEALALVPTVADETDFGAWDSLRALRGEIHCTAGQAIGLGFLLEVISERAARALPQDPSLARHRAVAGLCALRSGDRRQAVELAKASRAAFDLQPGVSAYFKRPLQTLEERLATR